VLPQNFLNELNQLTRWQQMAFGCALAQRMSPNFQLFAEATGFSSPLALRKFLDLFWEYLGSSQAKINFEVQQLQFDDLVPDPQQFDLYGVYPALDCCVAISSLFNLAMAPEGDEGAQISQVSLSSVAGFIEMQCGELTDEQLSKEPLMQEEIEFQQELYQQVLGFEKNSPQLKLIRTLGRNQDVSNLGISLGD
jgi:uncharacterized protein YjaG (DUF416 family)